MIVKKTIVKEQQRIRIRLQAFDSRILDKSIQEITNIIKRTGSSIIGPIPLPTKIEKIIVNRSPYVDKKSMEQFATRISKRMIEIINPTNSTIDELKKLNLPSGVDVYIKVK